MTNAIKMAIAATAQDSDLVAGLVDRNKLILSDDGKITGLDEQLKTIKESKPFLFKQEGPKPSGKRILPTWTQRKRGRRRERAGFNERSDCSKIKFRHRRKG